MGVVGQLSGREACVWLPGVSEGNVQAEEQRHPWAFLRCLAFIIRPDGELKGRR